MFFLFFVSGFCGLLYQIIWTRIAFASFGVISPILSIVISVFILGLSLGSWVGGKWISYLKKKTNFSAGHLKEDGISQQWFPNGESKTFEVVVRSLVDIFPYIRVYKSIEGWGFHFLASMEPFQTPSSKDSVSRLPAMAKDDLVEWHKGIEFYNDLEREDLIEEYFNLSFDTEILVELLLNQEDESIFISGDQPYNEYYLLRSYKG